MHFTITKKSLELTKKISDEINNQTFHHHYHILYDISESYNPNYKINYLEIGCYAGASACLLLQRSNTNVISIDIGHPISRSVVMDNVNKLNVKNNNFYYIEGNSHDHNVQNQLNEILNNDKVDILFIDGDHSYDGVKMDFDIYSKYVKEGGYIVFDDYNDCKYSPDVNKAVNDLDLSDYYIIGEFGSEFGARPKDHKSNEFVIRKKNKTKIAIVISTYYRDDGKTKFYLERTLNSLKKQINKNFEVFLIGDKYENIEEFYSYKNLLDNITCLNLEKAKEREKYKGEILWCYGGVNAINTGIELALSKGFNWIINLDHDDYFAESHINDIIKVIENENPVFVCSKSTYINHILPNTNNSNFIPSGSKLIKSSACLDFSKINLRFLDLYDEKKIIYPSDADFWNRVGKIIIENKYKSICTLNITCFHDEEGYSRKK